MTVSDVAGGAQGRILPPSYRNFKRGIGYLTDRFSWGLADQVVSSFTNFAISIYIARELGAVAFGAFTFAYTAYSYVLNVSRAIASTPMTIRFSSADIATWRRGAARSTGTAATLGLVACGCLVAIATVLTGSVRPAFFALGVTMPGLMLQDAWRFAFFALGRGSQAFVNDVIWAAALIPAVVVLRQLGGADIGLLVLVWGAAATIAAIFGILQARIVPSVVSARRWLADHWDLAPRYLIVGVLQPMAAQLRLFGLGLISGLAVVGYMQASNTLMGPITIMSLGLSTVLAPEAVRALRRSPRRLMTLCRLADAGFAIAPVAWGGVLLIAVPACLGALLLGPVWKATYRLLPLTIVFIAGWQARSGSATGLVALGAARRSLRIALLTSVLYVAGPLVGAFLAGATGFLAAMAATAWLAVPLYRRQLHAALRESTSGTDRQRFRPFRPAGRHRRRSHRRLWRYATGSIPEETMYS